VVAKTIELPNIKKSFLPDIGMTIGDFDLKGADAQVVAWEANDRSLMDFFIDGTQNIHDFNSAMMGCARPEAKAGCHLTNYNGKPKTLSVTTGMTLERSIWFQDTWFELHPGIKEWHERTWHNLQTKRRVENRFGYGVTYYDKITDPMLSEALAWIPQSTVGLIISKALIRVVKTMPWVHPLLQVHDSLVLQWPTARDEEAVEGILECMRVPVPYPEPLIIPASYKLSRLNLGECK
jgi:DNA polymerase I-like protein with 3'-5' exonuclease and polymerase domains